MAQAAKLRALKEQFKAFDTSGDGKLDFGEMSSLLRRGNPNMTDEELRALFDGIDQNGDGTVDFEEFVDYIYATNDSGGAKDVDGAKETFANFATGGSALDGKSFAKLCKDAGLVGGKFTTTEVDLIFAKVKAKTARTISFAEFERALGLIADKKGTDHAKIYQAVAQAGGPKLAGTATDAVRFYDDKSTFTGAAAKNPLFDGTGSRDVSPAAGRPVSRGPARPEPRTAEVSSPKAPVFRPEDIPEDGGGYDNTKLLEGTFRQYTGGKPDMDGREFAKMCKDSGLTDRKFTPTDVDLIFSKVCPRGQRRIGFEQFNKALGMVAEKKGCTQEQIQAHIAGTGGPVLKGTQAEAVRFHDDKTTYTGVHTQGGPSTLG